MAKSDFNLDDQEYDVVYDEKKKTDLFSKLKNNTKSKNKDSNNSLNEDNYDLGDFSSTNYVSSDVSSADSFEKIWEKVKNINVRTLIVIGGIFLIVFVVVFMVTLTIVKSNTFYTSEIIIPDVVYMGDSSGVSVTTKYIGNSVPKKDITETVSTFEVSNNNVISLITDKAIGNQITNVIIPTQEGRTTLKVVSKLNNRILSSSKKEVVVCPKFSVDSLMLKHISLTKNSIYRLNMNFENEECSKDFKYESSNDNIAIVDENGLVTAFNVGSAVLTVRNGDKSFNVNVDVTDKYVETTTFKAIPSELQLSKDEKYRLRVNYSPLNATSFNTNFRSSDESIVKVSERGLVEAVSPGTATIKVSGASFASNSEVKVVVTDKNQEGTYATSMVLDVDKISLVQGSSRRIKAILTPSTVDREIIKWRSLDDNIVYVTSNGVIYARNVGTASVEAYTDNGITKEVQVIVNRMKEPVISSSDGIASGKWHTKPYILSFSGNNNGIIFYDEGTSKNTFDDNKLVVSNDGITTVYVKSCTKICSQSCSQSKDNLGETSKKCESKCLDRPFICSNSSSYDSKLDTTKPYIESVIDAIDTSGKTNTVQISIKDSTSLVEKWCVTSKNSFVFCKWKTIKPDGNPKLNFVSSKNGTYYVFAKDVAGNVSDGYKFEINDIK